MLCFSIVWIWAEELVEREKNSFDVVCSLEVVEHVDNVSLFLSSLCTLLKVNFDKHYHKLSHFITITITITLSRSHCLTLYHSLIITSQISQKWLSWQPGGLLFLSTINRTNLSFLLTIVGAEYIFNWIPRGTHDWTKYLTPQEIITLLLQQKENSMHVVDVTGMYYNPLLGTWNETSNLTVNYILCATKQTINKWRESTFWIFFLRESNFNSDWHNDAQFCTSSYILGIYIESRVSRTLVVLCDWGDHAHQCALHFIFATFINFIEILPKIHWLKWLGNVSYFKLGIWNFWTKQR